VVACRAFQPSGWAAPRARFVLHHPSGDIYSHHMWGKFGAALNFLHHQKNLEHLLDFFFFAPGDGKVSFLGTSPILHHLLEML
jgi:hypothetical protein